MKFWTFTNSTLFTGGGVTPALRISRFKYIKKYSKENKSFEKRGGSIPQKSCFVGGPPQ